MPNRNPFTLFRAARPTFRSTFKQPLSRRRIETAAETNVEPPKNDSAFSKFLNSPVGPKTVHFWAPIMKWGVVLAGVADLARPAENLSLQQNAALVATGAIWTRWCFVIKPKNYFLATVNFFLFTVGATQCTRILLYRQSLKNTPLSEELAQVAQEQAEAAQRIVDDPQGAIEKGKKSVGLE
ncbi:MAG: hypothetical protein M1820_002041 [Bogoriella megaspora]|nr:MAG: hypothetical protein M1820_002041 [Bogoriella megaspora]